MRAITVEKLFEGCVSVRDYIVYSHAEQNKGLRIKYDGHEMYLSPQDLKRGRKGSGPFRKKYKKPRENPFYYLIDFKWKPNTLKLF